MYSTCRIATLHTKMHIFYMPDSHIAHKNACILYAGSQHCTYKCMYSICRMVMLHIKMHIFYMPDSHIAQKNAYIRPRPTRQVSGKKTVRRNMGKYLQKRAILTVFWSFRTKCPKSAFFRDIDCAGQTPRTQKNTCIL